MINMKENPKYYNMNDFKKLLERKSLVNAIITGRSAGKTFTLKRFMAQEGLAGRRFVYVRRRQTEMDGGMLDTFFEKIQSFGYFDEVNFGFEKGVFTADKIPIGYAVPLSTSVNFRSVDFTNVEYIIFEEFVILEDANHKYLKDEVTKFLELYSTVARDHDVTCFLIGNKISSYNPYFIYFDIIPPISGIKTYKDFSVQVLQRKEITERLQDNRMAMLLRGKKYSAYAVENKGLLDVDSLVVQALPKRAVALFNILWNGGRAVCFVDNDTCYIKTGYVEGKHLKTVSLDPAGMSAGTLDGKMFRKNPYPAGIFREAQKQNKIRFCDGKSQEIARELVKQIC